MIRHSLFLAASLLAACSASTSDGATSTDENLTGTIEGSLAAEAFAESLQCATKQAYASLGDLQMLHVISAQDFVAQHPWAESALLPGTTRVASFGVEHDHMLVSVWVVERPVGTSTEQIFYTGEGVRIALASYATPSGPADWITPTQAPLECGVPEPHDNQLILHFSHIVISRILPNAIELFNHGEEISLEGLSLQASEHANGAADTAALSQVLPLHGILPANGYYLVATGSSDGLPAPDLVATSFTVPSQNGKIAIAKTTNNVRCGSIGDPCGVQQFYDYVGYGATNDSQRRPAPALGTGLGRMKDGCQASLVNALDFTPPTGPARNSLSPAHSCE